MRVEILVREVRKKKNMDFNVLAMRAGISKGHLSRIERGETMPTILTLARLAIPLKVKTEELYKIVF